MTREQLVFDIEQRPSFEREDFLVSSSNHDAVSWIDMWPQWPASTLVIYGPPVCGKSHLVHVWQQKSGGRIIKASELSSDMIPNLAKEDYPLAIEGIDGSDELIGAKEFEANLFHLYNIFREQNRGLLLTMRTAPVRQNFVLRDLASRIRSVPSVHISPPDEELLSAVMHKMFSDRQVSVGQEVISYAVKRMERSFASAFDIVSCADNIAIREKRPVTTALIRKILEEKGDE